MTRQQQSQHEARRVLEKHEPGAHSACTMKFIGWDNAAGAFVVECSHGRSEVPAHVAEKAIRGREDDVEKPPAAGPPVLVTRSEIWG